MLSNITDEKLYFLCKKYGEIAVCYRNKFAGLLPEVFKRRLYEKKGFSSIFEFAAKLAGMSEEQVRRMLNLEKRFQIMPVLHEILVKGEVSVSKLAKVASIATTENQEILAQQVRLLPRKALETLVRDEQISQNENGLPKAKGDYESVPGNTYLQQNLENASTDFSEDIKGRISNASNIGNSAFVTISLPNGELLLSVKMGEKLLELQQKGIDINRLLSEFFEKRELEITQEKETIATEIQSAKPSSRYIPARVRNILTKEYGTKCSISSCTKPAEEIHHTQRFALGQNHNPQFLAPLCREHHIIAHTIDMQFHNHRPP